MIYTSMTTQIQNWNTFSFFFFKLAINLNQTGLPVSKED